MCDRNHSFKLRLHLTNKARMGCEEWSARKRIASKRAIEIVRYTYFESNFIMIVATYEKKIQNCSQTY